MAQHDYSIANQGFPATRADINNALSAIATNNSGTSAPSTQYAGQFWIDTTSSTWTLYIHDGTDDIQFATIDTSANTVNFIDSALDVVNDTTPQLGGNLDLNSNNITGTGNINITGTIQSSGNITGTLATASQPNITSVGTLTSFASTGIDDNATSTAITIDSSQRIGIGTVSPTNLLQVHGTSSTNLLKIGDGRSNNPNIRFDDSDTSNNGEITLDNTSLRIEVDEDNAVASSLIAFRADASEKMRIDSSGNVGIGTTSPNTKLQSTVGSNGSGAVNAIRLQNVGTTAGDGAKLLFTAGTSTDGAGIAGLGQALNSANLVFYSGGNTERMRIDSSGDVTINGTFPFGGKFCVVTPVSYTGANIRSDSGTAAGLTWTHFYGTSGSNSAQNIIIYGNGNIQNTNNSYGGISDIKIKKDIIDASSQWNDIKNIKVRKFRLKNDPTQFFQIGVVAQELEQVSPNLIDETQDFKEIEVPVLDDNANPVLNEDGTPQVTKKQIKLDTTTKSVKYSVLYMKAVKALQEAMERIEQLEARITTLENK